MAIGSVSVISKVDDSVHPFSSVTVTVYVPAPISLKSSVVSPFDQLNK